MLPAPLQAGLFLSAIPFLSPNIDKFHKKQRFSRDNLAKDKELHTN
ncbi:hypothetical protein VVMO6_04511 [Vibrio vulnificus MO6-24/O]|nr:hypothetical protein VVMO6_04511 [Vibrio vulnificus MO6-24/O]